MNNGFSNISGPTLNGLVDINADTIATSTIATSTIVLNGVDVSTQINQVPINTGNITALQQITTGQSYNSGTDTTTIDNNVIITGTLTTTPLLASQTYVNNQISALVASAPATLDTLNELAAALGNDANFSTTVINSLATKAPISTTVDLSSNQSISGIKTFTAVPLCNVAPTTANMLCNKTYVDGLVGSTVLVADSDAASTFYPIFRTIGAGQKNLLFDTSATPLSYVPNTGELSALSYTIGGSTQTAGSNASRIAQNPET